MRIRKRQVSLFPLSSLSPLPLSDPHLIHRSPPLVQLHGALPPKQPLAALPPSLSDHPQPSDRPLRPIGNPTDAWDSSRIATTQSGAHKQDLSDEDGRGRDEEGEKRNDTRKGGILGSHTTTPSSPSNNQDGRWCEGEKAIPLKKRRGSFERRGGQETQDNVYMTDQNNSNSNNKKMKTRMKTKMNKKCSSQNDNEEEEAKASKKRGRGGGVVMEGSRCSRVNGRGWRCCQQTLVGYSLCEHHLGKGRLRSMTSVRSRSIPTNKNEPDSGSGSDPVWGDSSSPSEKQSNCDSLGTDKGDEDKDEEEEEEKPLMVTKKRMKLGMVKARSLSSLLGQTNTQITLPEINDK